jgi:hypothetical protein
MPFDKKFASGNREYIKRDSMSQWNIDLYNVKGEYITHTLVPGTTVPGTTVPGTT